MERAMPSGYSARARGQAVIEYLIVTAAVGIVLLIPSPVTNNMPLAEFLARAVRSFFRGYSLLVSLF